MAYENPKALITQIQRFAVNDGPGFRTNVFLKGCALTCKWCHNPETQSFSKELYWKSRLCVQCGACLEVCPNGAVNPPIPQEEARHEGSMYYKIIHEQCDNCMKCVETCAYGALETVGKYMSVDEILEEVEQDDPFYQNSGGGMTVSGGEPTANHEFVERLLSNAKERGLHVCMDTSGHCRWEHLEKLAHQTDIILYDLKHLETYEHERMTGVKNGQVLENLENLSRGGYEFWLRVLVIPDLSDSMDYHADVVEFLMGLAHPPARIDLLPFHNWCEDKYSWLGRQWTMDAFQALDPSELELIKDVYVYRGLNATIGGSGFET